MKSLAVQYRPQTFTDVKEQSGTVTILKNQLETGSIKHCYLFCGPAGCGKTTLARIFAKEANNGIGNIIELDAASNNGVDDVRKIIDQAQTKPLEGQYKTFIIDECHSLSKQGWQAFLKLIEEPPATAIFIFCTTDPQTIPKTIISRVQRYPFQKISTQGIIDRLCHVLEVEKCLSNCELDAIEYIARVAAGGMRDALTMLDECLAFNENLTIQNVMQALSIIDYNTFINLTYALMDDYDVQIINILEEVYNSGFDLKQFIKQYVEFMLDVCKYNITEDITYTQLPNTEKIEVFLGDVEPEKCLGILDLILKIDKDIKYSPNPRVYIEALLLTGGMN